MMNPSKSSNSGPGPDPCDEFDADLANWVKNYCVDFLVEPVTNSGASVNGTTINPNYPSQPLMTMLDAGSNFGGASSNSANASQFRMAQELMNNSSMNPNNTNTLQGSGQILSSAIKTLSTHAAQSSQNQPMLQQVHSNMAVQQPQPHSLTNQSNITFDDQMRQFGYHLPSNQLLPGTVPMVGTPTPNLHSNHTAMVQLQQNLSQNQFQLQQVMGTSSDHLISVGGLQQESNVQANLRAPTGLKTPHAFPSSAAYRKYAFREIRNMKERYYSELQKMHRKATQRYTEATTVDDKFKFSNSITYLERMMKFLGISKVDEIPENDYRVCNYMNIIINYMSYNMQDKPGGSSQHCEPVPASPYGPSVQLPNPSQINTNPESNMMSFNQDFVSRRPRPEQSRMAGSSINTSLPRQQINLGPNTSNAVIGPNSPASVFSNATSNNLASLPLNHQPPVVNKMISSDKMKEPMHTIRNEFPKPKVQTGLSPLGSKVVSHNPPHQSTLPSSVKPVGQQASVSSSKTDANSMLSPPPIPLLLACSSSSPSGMSPLTTVEPQKTTAPMGTPFQEHQSSLSPSVKPVGQQTSESSSKFDANGMVSPPPIPFLLALSSSSPSGMSSLATVVTQTPTAPKGTPCQEPQTSKDAVHHLTQVVKSVSSTALSCSLNDISAMEKAVNPIPDCIPTNPVGQHINNNVNKVPRPKMKRGLTVTSTSNDPPGWANCSKDSAIYKKPKIENKWELLEEIKEINGKLLETTVHAMLDPSEDNITSLEGHEGTLLKCLFRNICFPDLLGPHGSISSEKMPEFGILLLIPFDYPGCTPYKVIRSGQNVLKSEPWGKLYEEMMTRFELLTHSADEQLCLGELAKTWDACARAVMTEYIRKLSGEHFGLTYGNWESSINNSSDSS